MNNKIKILEWQLSQLKDKMEKTRIKILRSADRFSNINARLMQRYEKQIKETETKLELERMKEK